jgi:hypothetical protein
MIWAASRAMIAVDEFEACLKPASMRSVVILLIFEVLVLIRARVSERNCIFEGTDGA